MKKGFVIEHTATYKTKSGEVKKLVSYFAGNAGPGWFKVNHLTGDPQGAKFYEKRILALNDLRRFFYQSTRVKVIAHTKNWLYEKGKRIGRV